MPSGEKESPGAPKTHSWYKLRALEGPLTYVDHPGLSERLRQALGNHLSPRILAKGKIWGSAWETIIASGSSTGESSDRWLCLKIKPEQGRQRKCERVHSPVDTSHVPLVPHNCGAGTSVLQLGMRKEALWC